MTGAGVRGAAPPAARPLGARAFAALMGPLGPFEAKPRLAVGVSGGADSMALALLAQGWVEARGGTLIALTVDHGLRPESAAEARLVGVWLKAHGLPHRVLRWRGAKPARGVPAAARQGRYALLGEFCRRRGILHLLLAHHLDDQAETLLLRLGRGSGVDGLAAMAPVSERPGHRVLRPFLSVGRARLEATLRRLGQDWVTDPSNADPTYARARLRSLAPVLAGEGLTAARLAATSARLTRARAALEEATAALLARHCAPHPAGFFVLDPEAFAAAPEEIALRALARVLMATSGAPYPPRLERLERLFASLRPGAPGRRRTLLGCRLALQEGKLLVCREATSARLALGPGEKALWDGRFLVSLRGDAPRLKGLEVRALDAEALPGPAAGRLPFPVRETLPALCDLEGAISVPHLNFCRRPEFARGRFDAVFRPANSLAGFGFSTFARALREG